MRIKLGAFTVALLGVLILIPSTGGWAWRTYGGVYGSHGVSWVAYKEVKRDNGMLSLNWEKIRPASARVPYRWEDEIEGIEWSMAWMENRGGYWLREARDAANAGAWDNVSYFFGIASFYWTATTHYGSHENVIRYYEYNEPYTDGDNSDMYNEYYDARVDHLDAQAEYYRPGEPVLIGQSGGAVEQTDYDYVSSEPDPLVDGTSREGVQVENDYTYTQSQDGSYEQIAEQNLASLNYENVASEENYEGGTSDFANAQADNGAYENIYEKDYGGGGGTTTYDYSSGAGTDKWAYEGSGANDDPPGSPGGTEFPAGGYDNIAASGDNRYTTSGGSSTNNPYHDFHFKITEGPANIDNIAFHWEGYGNAGTSTLYIWDFTIPDWVELGSHANTAADGTVDNWMADASNYIDANDNLHLCAVDIANAPDFIKTDYVKVDVTTAGGAAYRENVQHNITGVPSGYSSYELQAEYDIDGDSESVNVYVENFSSGGWDQAGTLTSTSLDNFAYQLDPSTQIGTPDDNVHVRYVQSADDSTQTSLMLDYSRVAYGPVDYQLNWEHRISGVTTGRDSYDLRIYGRNDTGDESVDVYVRNFSTGSWDFVDNLPSSDGWVEMLDISSIADYESGGEVSIRYYGPTTDGTRTNIFLDYVVLEEHYTTVGAGNPYPDLDSFLAAASEGEDSFLDNWMDNTMETDPTNPDPEGWWFEWTESRKAEDRGIQAGMDPTYGSFECVDLATTLTYSAWVYALGVQDQVDARIVSFGAIDPNRGAYFASDDYREDYRFPLYS